MAVTLYVDHDLYAETDLNGPAGIDAMMEEARAGFDLATYQLAALRDYKEIYIEPTNPDHEYTRVHLRGRGVGADRRRMVEVRDSNQIFNSSRLR